MSSETRQEFVRAAVGFLQNPKLIDSPLKDKLKFLRDKGLSDIEVDEALNLALVSRHQSQSSRWNFLLLLGLCIGGYKLYQSYLESKEKLANQQRDTERLRHDEDKLVQSHELRIQQQGDHPTLSEILEKMAELKRLIELQRTNFGTEIQSLKTLLLGHEKFAAPPVIPAWQMGDSDSKESQSPEKDSSQKDINKTGKKKGGKGKKTNSTNQSSSNGHLFTHEINQDLDNSPLSPQGPD